HTEPQTAPSRHAFLWTAGTDRGDEQLFAVDGAIGLERHDEMRRDGGAQDILTVTTSAVEIELLPALVYLLRNGVERRGMILVMQLATRNLGPSILRGCVLGRCTRSGRLLLGGRTRGGRLLLGGRTRGGRLLLGRGVGWACLTRGRSRVLDRRCRVAGIDRRRSCTIDPPGAAAVGPATATQDQQPQPRHSSTRQAPPAQRPYPLRKI